MPSQPRRQASRNTIALSSSKCSLRTMLRCEPLSNLASAPFGFRSPAAADPGRRARAGRTRKARRMLCCRDRGSGQRRQGRSRRKRSPRRRSSKRKPATCGRHRDKGKAGRGVVSGALNRSDTESPLLRWRALLPAPTSPSPGPAIPRKRAGASPFRDSTLGCAVHIERLCRCVSVPALGWE
jgi:hypothetical protein